MLTAVLLLLALIVPATAQQLGLGQICDRIDCLNRGACIGLKSAPLCLCDIGYQGARCEIEPLCTNLIACTNNGLCVGTARNFFCLCNIGFTGPNCAMPVGK
ncbi:hypothetical protein PRIPAC_74645 [Pristionchus pacificus]|uniref:EGF domain-containing protein n=1 Tax=Pristionchus pacificus TaxID=54126 RepID=A0A2A6C808_PRIPA|nr:hypothetical protein PRIPAC_74645 [Pristionchus pacificus]|eukprot:PDM74208.1 EGF domain-containing protein [Pristionchus pacificus]